MAYPPQRNAEELSDLHLSPRFDQLAAQLSLHQSPVAQASRRSTTSASNPLPQNVGYLSSPSIWNNAPQEQAGSTTMANRLLPESDDPYASPESFPDHPDFQPTPAPSRTVVKQRTGVVLSDRNDSQYPGFTNTPRVSESRGRSKHRHQSCSRTTPITGSCQEPSSTRPLQESRLGWSSPGFPTDNHVHIRNCGQTIVNQWYLPCVYGCLICGSNGYTLSQHYYYQGPMSMSLSLPNHGPHLHSPPHPPVIPPDTPAWDSAPSHIIRRRSASTRPLWRRLLSFVTCRP